MGGEQREVAQRKDRTTEEAGKIHLFIPALSVKSPVQFPLSARLSFSWFQLLPPSLPFSLCPALTQTPNPPPFTPHSFLNLKALLLYQPFINCSPCTSLLLTSSLFFLSITSEHATSQHNPFTHSRWLQHTLFFFLHLFFNIFFFALFLVLRLLSLPSSPPPRRSWPRLWMRCCSIHSSAWLRCFHHS